MEDLNNKQLVKFADNKSLRSFVQNDFDSTFEVLEDIIDEKYEWAAEKLYDSYQRKEYKSIIDFLDVHKNCFENEDLMLLIKGICYSGLFRESLIKSPNTSNDSLSSDFNNAISTFNQGIEITDSAECESQFRIALADLYNLAHNYFEEYRNLIGISAGTSYYDNIVEVLSPLTNSFKTDASIVNDFLLHQVDYSKRQFLFVAQTEEIIAGCYDDDITCYFPISSMPTIASFPFGHPQPNTLYYAHPVKPWCYIPFEEADQFLFDEKVREFQRLCQCLGAKEITFKSIKGRLLEKTEGTQINAGLNFTHLKFDTEAEYNNQSDSKEHRSENRQRELSIHFNPTKTPFVPNDLLWLPFDSDWQSLVNMRIDGDVTRYNVRISSRKTMTVSDSRLDSVSLAFNTVMSKIKGTTSLHNNKSFHREEETEWLFEVTFKSLEEFNNQSQIDSIAQNIPDRMSPKEQEYIDSLKDFLEDDAEITPRERKMLDRIRQSLGISEERAQELENSLVKPQLSEDEQEYLEMYQEYAEKGEVTEKERRRLDKFAAAMGITAERVKEIEKV